MEAELHVQGYRRRHAAAWLRWLHIYVSMFSFAILFFFAVTGLTLNHPDWFGGAAAKPRQIQGTLKPEWVAAGEGRQVAKLEVAEFLRSTHRLRGAVGDFRVEDSDCSVSFRGPGYSADVFIQRETGAYEITEMQMGLTALINDLHKGRDTGPVWSVVIDVSAILMSVVSLSGLALIWFVRRRRVSGLVWAGVGALISFVAYLRWVP